MPSSSCMGAVVEFIKTLTLPTGTSVWFDEVPSRDTAGIAVPLPYVVVKDNGADPEMQFEMGTDEKLLFDVLCYSSTNLDEAYNISWAVLFGGQPAANRAGLQEAPTLPVSTTYMKYEPGSVTKRRTQAYKDQSRASGGAMAYVVQLSMSLQQQVGT